MNKVKDDADGPPPPGASGTPSNSSKDKAKRGYRACLHCRSRKAKCDLGDIDAPSSPPCSRCRRESRECVFAPSRRGGNSAKRKRESEAAAANGPGGSAGAPGGAPQRDAYDAVHANNNYDVNANSSNAYDIKANSRGYDPNAHYDGPHTGGSTAAHASSSSGALALSVSPSGAPTGSARAGAGPARGNSLSGRGPNYPPHVDVLNPSPKGDYLFNHPSASSTDLSPSTAADPSPAPLGGDGHGHNHAQNTHASTGGHSAHSHSRSAGGHSAGGHSRRHSPGSKRRRLHLNPPLHTNDPSSIVVADMQNESDALHILALASAADRGRPQGSRSPCPADSDGDQRREPNTTRTRAARGGPYSPARIDDFALVRLGIVDEEKVQLLTSSFFRFYHHIFPMVSSHVIPRTPEQLADFCRRERYLVTAMIIIASRNEPGAAMRTVHEQSWKVMRGWISDIQCLGAPPTVGIVEALLLLAEWIPRDPPRDPHNADELGVHAQGFGEEVHGAENRQAWMLIGMAIRCAYELGLEKLAVKLFSESERTYEVERARLAYTYCYLFDRHVALRLGKAFWSRGPSLCFQGFSASAQTGPAIAPGNFPFLREIPDIPGSIEEHPQEDLASLVQTYLELTQLMSNAHDVLYPNAARTRSLVIYGEYFKYIDELARSLDGFRILWREKKWKLFPLTDAVWATFYYVQLYICGFSFQAHVERAALKAEEEYNNDAHPDAPRPPLSLFPRGAAASPDARYIFQSIDAARQLLHICVDRIVPGGALPYLPNRFLLWFTYAAIVLLKARYSGAMLRADHADAHLLINRLVDCFLEASPVEDHPAIRYGHQLQALQYRLEGMQTSANSPTGGHTVPLPSGNDHDGSSGVDTVMPWINDHPPTGGPGSATWMNTLDGTEQGAGSGAPMTFPYATAPDARPSGFDSKPLSNTLPPHAQPITEMAMNLSVDNNLGFATLDWFGMPTGSSANGHGGGGGGGGGSNGGSSGGMVGQHPTEGDVLGALDLADFWMKVGPGEAQGGFPFR